MSLRFLQSATLAALAVSIAFAGTTSGWARGILGGKYQDSASDSTGTNTTSAAARLAVASNTKTLTVQTVSCRIEGSAPPYDVNLVSVSPTAVYSDDVYLPFVFTGQSAANNFWIVNVTNINYGVQKGWKPVVRAAWGTIGTNRFLRCTVTGDLQ